MKPLYEIAADYAALFEDIESSDMPEDKAQDLLDSVSGALESKALSVGAFIKNMRVERDAASNAACEMKERADVVQRKIDHWEEYLRTNLEKAGVKAVSGAQFAVRIQGKRPKVHMPIARADIELLPEEYVIQYMLVKPSAERIGEALKAGAEIHGCKLGPATKVVIK